MGFFDFLKDYSLEAREIRNYLVNKWGMNDEYANPFVYTYKKSLGQILNQGRGKIASIDTASPDSGEFLQTLSENELRFSIVNQAYVAYFKDLRSGKHINTPIEYAIWAILVKDNDLIEAQNPAFARFILRNAYSKVPFLDRVFNFNNMDDHVNFSSERLGLKVSIITEPNYNSLSKGPQITYNASTRQAENQNSYSQLRPEKDNSSEPTQTHNKNFYNAFLGFNRFNIRADDNIASQIIYRFPAPFQSYFFEINQLLKNCSLHAQQKFSFPEISAYTTAVDYLVILILARVFFKNNFETGAAVVSYLTFFIDRCAALDRKDQFLFQRMSLEAALQAANNMLFVSERSEGAFIPSDIMDQILVAALEIEKLQS